MEDWLNKIFIDKESKLNKSNPMEKKKLKELNEKSDKLYNEYQEKYNEINKIRNSLPDPSKKEKIEFIKERDLKLLENSVEMRELKKRRQDIHKEFKIKTYNIKQLRKDVLDNSKELKETKKDCQRLDSLWEETRREFDSYYRKLLNKYQNSSTKGDNTQEMEE